MSSTSLRHSLFSTAWLLLVSAVVASRAAFAADAPADLGPAPEFSVRTLEGREISRTALAGKVVVVNFWATWCPDCMNALPGYIALQEEFGERDDFVFLGISLDERPADFVRKFVGQEGINFPVAMGDEALKQSFGGISEIPTTFVIDRSGTIRYRQPGSVSPEKFRQLIHSLL